MLWTVKFVEPVPARQDICPVSCRRGWDAPCEDRLIALSLDVCVQRRGHGGLRRPPLALYVLPLQRQPANTGIRLMKHPPCADSPSISRHCPATWLLLHMLISPVDNQTAFSIARDPYQGPSATSRNWV